MVPSFNLADLLPKSLKKMWRQMRQQCPFYSSEISILSQLDNKYLIFNIYSALKYVTDSLDLMSTIAEFCTYIAVEFV